MNCRLYLDGKLRSKDIASSPSATPSLQLLLRLFLLGLPVPLRFPVHPTDRLELSAEQVLGQDCVLALLRMGVLLPTVPADPAQPVVVKALLQIVPLDVHSASAVPGCGTASDGLGDLLLAADFAQVTLLSFLCSQSLLT